MLNLGQLEDRLNRDPAFRRQFFDDPVGVLRKEGLYLSMAQESALRDGVSRMNASGGSDPLSRRNFGFMWYFK